MISVDQALEFMLARARPLEEAESVPLTEALGRVLAHAEISPIDVPGYANSSMDGYAVRAGDAAVDGSVSLPVGQRIAAGDGSTKGAACFFLQAALPDHLKLERQAFRVVSCYDIDEARHGCKVERHGRD